MKEKFLLLRQMITGKWYGEGFASYPTISNTAYTEHFECMTDDNKDVIFFNQKTYYKNDAILNGNTVFWDTGFIILKNDAVVLHSAQVSGRMEIYALTDATDHAFTFNSVQIINDDKAMQSQRIFFLDKNDLHYELNMATHDAEFQNHLKANLKKINI